MWNISPGGFLENQGTKNFKKGTKIIYCTSQTIKTGQWFEKQSEHQKRSFCSSLGLWCAFWCCCDSLLMQLTASPVTSSLLSYVTTDPCTKQCPLVHTGTTQTCRECLNAHVGKDFGDYLAQPHAQCRQLLQLPDVKTFRVHYCARQIIHMLHSNLPFENSSLASAWKGTSGTSNVQYWAYNVLGW